MILVTGGAGYIGSHTCVELLNAGLDVTVFDNFCNSHPEALRRVEHITGKKLRIVQGDCRDRSSVTNALQESQAIAVIHFAGLKAVGESVQQPLAYYYTCRPRTERHDEGNPAPRLRSEEHRVTPAVEAYAHAAGICRQSVLWRRHLRAPL